MAKPAIIVNGGDPGAMTSVSASSAWTATLDSTDGVRGVEWSVSSTDETTAAASYTLVQSGSVGQNVAGTSQGQGTAIILKVVVNAGNVGDQPDPENTSAKIKIVVPLPDGGIVGCAGEEYESDPTFGATGIINASIRKAALLSPSGVPVKIVRAATAAALPTNTRTGNVLTASANGAIGTVGGVAVTDGDYILVQNEGGGASHVNNGVYVLADGDAGSPWTLTRATYFDDSAELIAMTTFRIQEGTYAGKERYLVTSGATINVTALEFAAYGYAPNDAAYLTVGAVSDLSAERNISAVGTTLTFESTATTPLGAKRTDSATAALVDVAEVTALSSGSAAAGFGPSVKFLGEVSGGGAENYGLVGFAATDLTGGSEDTKAVLQTRTAGAALATVAEFSGTSAKLPGIATGSSGLVAIDADGTLSRTASGSGLDANAHVLEDAATALGANGVPIRALGAPLGFAKTSAQLATFTVTAAAGSVYEAIGVGHVVSASGAGTTGDGVSIAARLVDATPSARQVGRIRWEWISPVALTPRADCVISVLSTDGEHDWLRLTDAGALVLPAYSTAARRPIFAGTDGTITATAIQFGEVQTALSGLAAGVLHEDGSGNLTSSTVVNADVSAAAAIAGTKISPDFGSQNVTTTGSITAGTNGFIGPKIDRATSGTFTLGSNITTLAATALAMTGVASLASTGSDLTVTPDATYQLVVRRDALTTTNIAGVSARNATAATSGVTVQDGPGLLSEGTAWTTASGGSSKTIRGGILTVPETGSSTNIRVYRVYDTGGGTLSRGDYWASSDPALFGPATVTPTVIITSSGFGVRFDSDGNGGLKKDSTDVMVTSGGSNAVVLATNSTRRHVISSTGAITKSKDTSAVERTQHGTAGVNYVDSVGLAATVTASGSATLYTIATVSNSYIKVEVDATAYDTTSVTACRIFGKRRPFKNIAGTITDGTAIDIHADDDLGTVWGTPPTLTITSSGTNILVTGAATSNDTRFIIHEIRVYCGTTSA